MGKMGEVLRGLAVVLANVAFMAGVLALVPLVIWLANAVGR